MPVEETAFSVLNGTASTLKHLTGHKIIHWDEVVDIAQKAHSCFSDLFSIGWDLAVTPDGVRLIEGNINWAVDPHQINKPLLMPGHIYMPGRISLKPCDIFLYTMAIIV